MTIDLVEQLWVLGITARALGFAALCPRIGRAAGLALGYRTQVFLVLLLLALPVADGSAGNQTPGHESLWLWLAANLAGGLLLGWVATLAVLAVQWAGDIVERQLGYIPLWDETGDRTGIVERVYVLGFLAVLLISGGHRMIVASFLSAPVSGLAQADHIAATAGWQLAAAMSAAVQLAAPLMIALTVARVGSGLIARVIPIYADPSVVKPLFVLLGLLLVGLSLGIIPAGLPPLTGLLETAGIHINALP